MFMYVELEWVNKPSQNGFGLRSRRYYVDDYGSFLALVWISHRRTAALRE